MDRLLVTRRSLGIGALAGAAAVVTGPAGCSAGRQEPSPDAGEPPNRVRVLTGAGPYPWEAYLDLAIAKGWFGEANLEVEVLPGEGTSANLKVLLEGEAEFAALDVSAAVIAYAQGSTDFTLSCVLHNNLLACVMAPESVGVTRLRDLEGRSVAVLPGGTNTLLLPALARLAEFDVDEVEQVPLYPPFFPYVQSGTVDVALEFLPSQPSVEGALGEPVRVFPYAEWFPEVYGTATGVTRTLAAGNPGLVRRFNQVSLEALQYAVDNPAETAEVFVEAHPENNRVETVTTALELLAPYVRPEPGLASGEINPDRLVQTSALLEELGAIDASVEPGDLYTPGLHKWESDEEQ